MADELKKEGFLSELNSLESMVSMLVDNYLALVEKNKKLENQIIQLNKEIEFYKLKASSLENDIEKFKGNFDKENIFSSLNSREKENLKLKIDELIDRINYHIRSS